MKKWSFVVVLGFSATLGLVGKAEAACACVCLEGVELTLCNDMAEAAANPNQCLDRTMQAQCPAPSGTIDTAVDQTAPEGTTDCHRARFFDPATGGYTTIVNVCGLLSAT